MRSFHAFLERIEVDAERFEFEADQIAEHLLDVVDAVVAEVELFEVLAAGGQRLKRRQRLDLVVGQIDREQIRNVLHDDLHDLLAHA